MESIPFIGEIFALAAPICWSLAVILFRKTGEAVPALVLNLFKNILATLLFTGTLFAAGEPLLRAVPRADYLLLLISGVIGIGLSDMFFFMCLNRVGAGLQAIVNTTYSPTIILLSVLFLGERLSGVQILGTGLILGAVVTVAGMKGPREGITRRTLLSGLGFGLLATLTQGVSIVMIKPLLEDTPLIWANCWRLAGGLLASAVLLVMMPLQRRALGTLTNVRIWRVMIPGSVMGTYVSLLFWLGGMKYTQASTASALNQTATLWTFALAALLLKEPITGKRVAGLGLGIIGVALVTFG